MSKHEKSGDKHEKGNNRNLVGQDGPGKTSENEVFKNLDDGRRGFLKKAANLCNLCHAGNTNAFLEGVRGKNTYKE